MTKTQEIIHKIITLIGHLDVKIIDMVYKDLSSICSPKDDDRNFHKIAINKNK